MTDFLQIANTNPLVFCQELQEAVQNGYVIDEARDFAMYFNLFTIGMKKTVEGETYGVCLPVFNANEEVVTEAVKSVGRPKKVNKES